MHDPPPPHPAPPGLSGAGLAFWESICDVYELDPPQLRLLEDTAREVDIIARLEQSWADAGHPMTVTGSMKQEVAHPALSEMRQHRSVIARLIKDMKLPDAEDEEPADVLGNVVPMKRPMSRQEVSKMGNDARWGSRRGRTS